MIRINLIYIVYTVLFIGLVPSILLAQDLVLDNLSAGFYSSYVYSDKGTSIPEGINTWEDDNDYLNIKLSLKYRKISIHAYYTSYGARTAWNVRESQYTYTHPGGRIRTYNIGIGKELLPRSKWLKFEPFLSVGLQQSLMNTSLANYGLDFRGPLVYSVTEAEVEKDNILQFIPSAGLRIYSIIGKRILFGVDAQFTYAFKPYQKIYFDYYTRYDPTIKTAEFTSSGTGYFICPFIGINFGKKKPRDVKYDIDFSAYR